MSDSSGIAQLLYGADARQCLRGHGPMERLPGLWVSQQVERVGGGLLGGGDAFNATGQLFTYVMLTCKTCGTVEMVNEEYRK